MKTSIVLLGAAQLAAAHFGIEYPEWRADTLATEDGPYSQWDYPCANVPDGSGNRTQWPLSGGAVSLELHHPWTYVFVNLGLGDNVTNFNMSLTPSFLNVTGNGTFCLPELSLPGGVDIANGTNASIQVVTSGESGSALYNCADVVLVEDAPGPADGVCVNTTQSSVVVTGDKTSDDNSTNSTSGAGASGTSGAQALSASTGALAGFVGMGLLFAAGMVI
ncbi:hypothetical protein KJ359_006979 [Pestalotiopsis sp. 9143b]|nr:hypothetical protein KJ359_006979 [Pestalotiopsis sp. 9143b]